MGIYFIRNKENNEWCDSNSYTTSDVESARMRYWSEKNAAKARKDLISTHNRLNRYHEANGTPLRYSVDYEIVAFKLVEVGVVS